MFCASGEGGNGAGRRSSCTDYAVKSKKEKVLDKCWTLQLD